MQTITVRQGDPIAVTIEVRDLGGRLLTGHYDGTETLSARAWAGDDRAPWSPGLVLSWSDADGALIDVDMAGDDTATIARGIYKAEVLVDGAPVIEFGIEILAAPGIANAPITYGTYDGVLRRAGDWLAKQATEAAQASFAEELHEAVIWTHRNVLSRVESYLSRRSGGYFGDPEGTDLWTAVGDATGDSDGALMVARLAIVSDALETGTALTLTDTIIAANEHYAAAMILNRLMSSKDDNKFPSLAIWHSGRANALLGSSSFGVDTDGDGVPNFSLPPV